MLNGNYKMTNPVINILYPDDYILSCNYLKFEFQIKFYVDDFTDIFLPNFIPKVIHIGINKIKELSKNNYYRINEEHDGTSTLMVDCVFKHKSFSKTAINITGYISGEDIKDYIKWKIRND